MNDSGTVAFIGVRDGRMGVYQGTTGLPKRIAEADPSEPMGVSYAQIGGSIDINNKGEVAFTAIRVIRTAKETFRSVGVFSGNPQGEPATTAAGPQGTLRGFEQAFLSDSGHFCYSYGQTTITNLNGDRAFLNASVEAFNNRTQMAYLTLLTGGQLQIERATFETINGFFVQSRIDRMAKPAGSWSSDRPVFVMNDSGTILFRDFSTSRIGRLVRVSDTELNVLLTSDETDSEFSFDNGRSIALNNREEFAFVGYSRSLRKRGVYRGSNPVSDRVVAVGDTVNGEEIFALRNERTPVLLNDAGQVCFQADVSSAAGFGHAIFVTTGVCPGLTGCPKPLYAVLLAATGDPTRERRLDTTLFKKALLRFPGVEAGNIWEVSSVLGAYDAMSAIGSRIKPGDTLLFFYVGHGDWNAEKESEPEVETSAFVSKSVRPGVLVNRGDEYLAVNSRDMFLPDGSPNKAAEYITDDELTTLFLVVPNTEHVRKLAILSACFSGGFWGKPGNATDGGDLDKAPNTALFASAPEGDTGQSENNITGDGRSLFAKAIEGALNQMAETKVSLSFNHLRDALSSFYSREKFDPSRTADFFADGPWFETSLPIGPGEAPPTLFAAATVDFDRDAALDESSSVEMMPPVLVGNTLQISIQTIANRNYALQANPDLTGSGWINLTNVVGNGEALRVSVPLPVDLSRRFFRVRTP